jgi:hypothetical protein
MAKRILILAFCFIAYQTYAQYESGVTIPDSTKSIISDESDLQVKYANTILAEDMKRHLTVIAGDGFEGRETGEQGNNRAAGYIADHFRSLQMKAQGVEGSFYQSVAFTFSKWTDSDIFVGETRYKHMKDFVAFPQKNESVAATSTAEVIYMGYGIDDPKYSDYKKNDVKGKVILINKGEPVKKDSTYWITGSADKSEWSTNPDKKLIAAKKNGVKLVLIIENDLQGLIRANRNLVGSVTELGDKTKEEIPYANHIYISSTLARDIIGKKEKKIIKSRKRSNKKGKACDVKVERSIIVNQSKSVRTLLGQNVLGFIEGTDKKDEVVVISAHYDHLGMRGEDIYNGADDNGSGTTTVLELAEAFRLADSAGHGPRRSVLFLLVTGEEKGLLGSYYYAENPVYALDKTVVDVNIDMVGRVDEKYSDNPNYIYVIGSDRLSTDLHKINEEANSKYAGLTLDYKYNSESDPNRFYYRSDHFNFAKNGIPAIFFFNGVHADYHRTTDTVDKINFEKMEKVGRLIFHTAWELANRDERIRVDGEIK